ncbi:conjugal transfer protein TraB [Escherichia coli]|nr:conjugal transfer protein TraB [Escherichia coli]
MYGTCETLCRELAAKYPGYTPLMLVIWSPEEIQALADGMDISLSDPEIRTVLARLEDIPEDQRIESGISSAAAMEIISNVSENRQVTVPAELLASLIQTAEPVPQMPASPPGPEGEPQPGNTPVSFPPQGSVAVPPPTAFYPGNGVTPPPQVTYQSVPVPNRIQRKVFTRNEGKQGPSLPYIPSGSFAKAMLIEGADANASVTGNESTVPMQLRITGLVEMPNSKTYDATGCFVGLEAWGDVSSERAIVRTRNISCLKDGKTIDMPIKGHVSFRGKNGIKGEVVMRNGKILGWAWGAGFVDGIGQGMERASQPAVGLGATAAYGAGDVLKMGIGGGASKAAQTLSDYYIKRAEQYHPVIPIGAGNEVTVVFQDGFQLKTVEEMALERTQSRAEEDNPESPVPVPPSAESHLNGFNTDQMLKQLGNLNPQQFISGSQGGGNDGK